MKTFNPFIHTSRVLEVEFTIRNTLGGIPAASMNPLDINWEALAEYIFEMWGGQYDNDDIDFVHDHLFVDPWTYNLYVLEVQEQFDGTDELVVEVVYTA